MTYEKILDPYQNLPIPIQALYRKEPNSKIIFMTQDHPQAFLSLTEEQQKRLVAWCCRWEKIKSTNHNNTSYGLKHAFGSSQGGFYVTNGQFKGAMLIAGFTPSDPNKLNWNFNISRKSVKQIFQEAQQNRRRGGLT